MTGTRTDLQPTEFTREFGRRYDYRYLIVHKDGSLLGDRVGDSKKTSFAWKQRAWAERHARRSTGYIYIVETERIEKVLGAP